MARKFLLLLLAASWLLIPLPAKAASAPNLSTPNGLSFAEVQITGDEFIVLQNNTGSAINDLNSYWLYYFNKTDPQGSGVKITFYQLPAGRLEPGESLMLSTIGRPACGAAIVDNLSFSLADGGGFLEIVKLSVTANGAVNQLSGDSVSWSSGTTGNIQKVASTAPQPIYYRYQASAMPSYSWQKAAADSSNACQLIVAASGSNPSLAVNSGSLRPASSSPPAIILSLDPENGGSNLPASDVGLEAPQISELLPNPKSPQTDAKDEFIEIYNPNDKSFDLSGFKLEAGTETKHQFSFGSGTKLAPKGFTFFLSVATGLTLTNDSGQVKLLSPAGEAISQTDAYESAKDGQSWALANGHWYWTTQPTPGGPNIVNQTEGGAGPTPAGRLANGSTVGNATGSNLAYTLGGGQSSGQQNNKAKSPPLHAAILAAIGLLALSYALYEYRHDLANAIEKFRRYRKARRTIGQIAEKPISPGATVGFGGRQNNFRSRLSQGFRHQGVGQQPKLHSKPGVPGQVWYEALPFRLLPLERIRRGRRAAKRSD